MAKKGKGSGGSMDFKVTASGLDKVNKDAKKTGQSFNTLDKNARSTDRAMKGVSNMSSNTTKNFSKMSQGITGGLVPAYATLAAQLFALDALFRFFREAADFRVLQKGQELFAASTGRAMRTLSRDIQAATSAQITFKEASQATAIGLSAGLSPTMLKELGEAARTVSVALGRDTTDSFNRLIRGVTKAEPELLDELGIILRLEEATTRYAASLGLNKNQLTTFQKSQAVANEVLRQAESRYGAINDKIGDDTVNQLNKLMVSFDEVLNRIRIGIAPLAEFFGTFLSENIESATAAIGVFAASITGGLLQNMIPKIDYARSAAVAAQVTGAGDLKVSKMMSEERIGRLQSGRATEADIAAYSRAVNAKKSKMIEFEQFTRREHQKTVRILRAQRQRMVADANVGFERMKQNFIADLYEMEAVHGTVMGRMKFVGLQFGKAMNAVLRFAGLIGIAVMLFQMGKQIFDMFRNVDEAQEKAIEKANQHTESMKSLADEVAKTAEFYRQGLFGGAEERIRAIGGAFQSAEIAQQIDSTERAFFRLGADSDAVKENIKGLQKVAIELGNFDERFLKFAALLEEDPVAAFNMAKELKLFSDDAIRAGQAVDSMTRAQANFEKQFNAFIQKGEKIPFQDIVMSLNELQKEQYAFAQSTDLTTDEQKKANAEYQITLLRLEGFISAFKLATARQMEFVEAQRAGLRAGTALFGQKEDIQNALKLAGQIDKILQKREDIFAKEMAIDNMQAGIEKDLATQKLKFAEQQLKLEKERLAMMIAEQNKFIKAFGDAATSFGNELGKALGQVFRGESPSMKEFGKTMVKVLTDSLGKAIANRIMRIAYRGTPLDPDVQIQKYSREVEDMLEQKGRDTAAKLRAAGDDNATNGYKALNTGGKDASVNLYNAMDHGGKDASLNIYNRMVGAANYHAYKIKTAQRDILQAEKDRLGLTKASVDKEIQDVEDLIGAGDMSGMKEKRDAITRDLIKQGMGIGMLDYAGLGNTNLASTSQIGFNTLKMAIFDEFKDGVRDYGYQGMGDKRNTVVDQIQDARNNAFRGLQTGDLSLVRQGLEEYQGMDSRLRNRIAQSNDPRLQEVHTFFSSIEKNLSTLELFEEEIRGGLKTQKEYEERLDGLITTSKNLEKEMTVLDKRIEDTGFKDLTAPKDPGTGGAGFTSGDGSGFTVGGDSTGEETGSPTGGPLGGGGALTFQEMTKSLFPSLMKALGGDDATGVASFAQGALHFSTVVTQFGTLIGQGLALAGKQEEAADLMMEVAKIQMALAIIEMATKVGESIYAIKQGRYGRESFMYGGYTHGGVTDGPEAGYNVRMHGREAIVPLGNDRSIPVKLMGSSGSNNVNVTVNVDQNGQSETLLSGDGARELGKTIAAIAQDTIVKEQRAGGLLSSI